MSSWPNSPPYNPQWSPLALPPLSPGSPYYPGSANQPFSPGSPSYHGSETTNSPINSEDHKPSVTSETSGDYDSNSASNDIDNSDEDHNFNNTANNSTIPNEDNDSNSTTSNYNIDLNNPLYPSYYHHQLGLPTWPLFFTPPIFKEIRNEGLSWKHDHSTHFSWIWWRNLFGSTIYELYKGVPVPHGILENLLMFREDIIFTYKQQFPDDLSPPTVETFIPNEVDAVELNRRFYNLESIL
ncbi:hypothetical protein CROQUDRAFT_130614 [Cronartium quercuum f. sp. fusiforme G11]|uniref:Uncharacterized protein n=1 Tax=Cronartium quercuum f. sp. fusiforme G11 TaxID=708437 RepID=A0A9P6NWF9_9BASI|nr:hypothetical protein CROQUDRAFT_130614 [Cronartium quercuum f. sp. fusiforme G11]